MSVARPKKIVLLGMMSRWPVAGVAWVTVQYLEGLRRLGYDAYYVEAHGCTQTKFMVGPDDDGVADCRLPVSKRFPFRHSPPVVVTDFWQPNDLGPADTFTTVGNWRQPY